jgi:GTP cyclohydrolase IA
MFFLGLMLVPIFFYFYKNREPISSIIRRKMIQSKKRFWAKDNISDFVNYKDKEKLIKETTKAFENVLKALLIDYENDPNSKDTPKRMAKMYMNELMAGRYDPRPPVVSFPNSNAYNGMLVVRSEFKSMCSHHHQPVSGVAHIGIMVRNKLIGLSKYSRIVQWYAGRGTLQEELCKDIADDICKTTETKNVAVHMKATHGCCENRGIMSSDSSTQTSVFMGKFLKDQNKKDFFEQLKN